MRRPAREGRPTRRLAAAVAAALILFSFSAVAAVAAAGDLVVGNFSGATLSGWTPKTFKGKTAYSFVEDGGRWVLMAQSHGAASALIKKITLDPKEYPVLRWSWKIGATIPKGDGRTKAGDDYAARVYVVFPRTFFWRTRSIEYVWGNRVAKGTFLPSPFSGKFVMVAVESGNENAGKWVDEERNVYEDYKKAFGEDPPKIGAVALMTDTDQTGQDAVAYYGDITIGKSSSP